MKTIRFAAALLGAAAFLAASPKAEALTLSFVNNSAVSGSNVWITFGGANNSTLSGTLTYSGTQQAIAFGASYNLAQISGSIALLNANAGKIFVSYGAGLGNASAVGNPDFQYLSGDPTAQVRWDKIEYTLFSNTTQGQSAVNMSAADFYSIPMQVTTSLSGAATGTLGWHPQTSTSTVFYNLGSLATGSTRPYAVVTATTTTGSNFSVQATFSGTTLNVLRIINPNNVNLNVTNPYPSLLPYATFTSTVGGSGTSANISSYYVGAGTTSNGLPASAWAAQNYSFTSSVASSGNMVISGSGSAVGAQTITIQAADLGVGLYSNAPNYYLNSFGGGTTPLQNSNCVYDAIISDVLAAYNMGLVGSTKIDPRFSGSNIVVGGEPSGQWYSVGGTPYATNPKLAPEQLFSFMQPNSPAGTPFYNPFAAYLAPITDAYGFPYTDKTASPQLNITPGAADAMVITILPDVAPVSGLDSPRPAALPKAIRDDWTTYSYLKIKGEGKTNSGSILLHLRIKHPDISELTVRLVSPWGKSFLIHDRTGAGTADLVIPGAALSLGKKNILANGLWTLVVRDAKKGNKGTIVDWGLQFP